MCATKYKIKYKWNKNTFWKDINANKLIVVRLWSNCITLPVAKTIEILKRSHLWFFHPIGTHISLTRPTLWCGTISQATDGADPASVAQSIRVVNDSLHSQNNSWEEPRQEACTSWMGCAQVTLMSSFLSQSLGRTVDRNDSLMCSCWYQIDSWHAAISTEKLQSY